MRRNGGALSAVRITETDAKNVPIFKKLGAFSRNRDCRVRQSIKNPTRIHMRMLKFWASSKRRTRSFADTSSCPSCACPSGTSIPRIEPRQQTIPSDHVSSFLRQTSIGIHSVPSLDRRPSIQMLVLTCPVFSVANLNHRFSVTPYIGGQRVFSL